MHSPLDLTGVNRERRLVKQVRSCSKQEQSCLIQERCYPDQVNRDRKWERSFFEIKNYVLRTGMLLFGIEELESKTATELPLSGNYLFPVGTELF